MNKLIFLALCALLPATTAASAADPFYPPDTPISSAQYDWSGFYAGINAGYGSGEGISTSTNVTNIGLRGGVYGIQAGFNWQSDMIVAGVEANISHGDIAGSTACTSPGFTCSGDIDTIASLHARVGSSIDNYLIYGLAGVAYGHAFTDADPTYPGYGFGTLGYVLGAGIEVGLTEQISGRLEYSYLAFQRATAPAGTLAPGATTIDGQVHTIEVGLNYHF